MCYYCRNNVGIIVELYYPVKDPVSIQSISSIGLAQPDLWGPAPRPQRSHFANPKHQYKI